MKFKPVTDDEIKKEFMDNFSSYSMDEKRKSIAMCIMKNICGYSDSAILLQILKSMKLISKNGNVLKRGKEFMFDYYYRSN
jgi:muramoyltetrapeptide carboxypeptidase LdcA involved in peptidoglycan recycling